MAARGTGWVPDYGPTFYADNYSWNWVSQNYGTGWEPGFNRLVGGPAHWYLDTGGSGTTPPPGAGGGGAALAVALPGGAVLQVPPGWR